ncbi:hypothetical protein D9611_001265 [Ephemerocybe angulata]|uniref:DUF829-domain-containing protein n=1 Tax=Ephemerocybe angulata TaxID=980116 RepID=A0A8H5CKH7_9AGAR|nr:hypothetical protein D9611_001265 [Tulosesus angulatus]
MASENTQNGLTAVANGVYVKRPIHGDSNVPALEQPTVIIIFGWADASLRHIAKYTRKYDELYASATQIVVTCQSSTLFMPQIMLRRGLEPVVEILQAVGCLDGQKDHPPRILAHIFSDGGSSQMAVLSNMLQDQAKALGSFEHSSPPCAVIFDSCPSNGGMAQAQKVLSMSIRNPVLYHLAIAVYSVQNLVDGTLKAVFGVQTFPEAALDALNRPSILPWFSKASPRLYIYSKADRLVHYAGVEMHAGTGRKLGLDVRMVHFEDSPHIRHAVTDSARYWGAVRKLWEEATYRSQDRWPSRL